MTVNDTNPHFFHSIATQFETNCLLMANLSVIAKFPESVDEIFVLNPVFELLKVGNEVDE